MQGCGLLSFPKVSILLVRKPGIDSNLVVSTTVILGHPDISRNNSDSLSLNGS